MHGAMQGGWYLGYNVLSVRYINVSRVPTVYLCIKWKFPEDKGSIRLLYYHFRSKLAAI